MPNNLEDAIVQAGSPTTLLWESQSVPYSVPRVPPEFTNWRDEQLAWRKTSVLFDQSHHMENLVIEGPDALKLISDLGVNSFQNFPVDKAKQFVAVNHDGYVIGDNILFHLDEDQYSMVGLPPAINWVHYHAVTGGYEVRVDRDDSSATRQGDPALYRYQVQGPNALDVIREAIGQEPPQLKFFSMTRFTIGGREVRALRHGMAGEPGFELWGPWSDAPRVLEAILEAGKAHGLVRVGGKAYPTNTLESGWVSRPLPAIYTGEQAKGYRRWLRANAYEAVSPMGGSYYSTDITDYYMTPFDLDYGRVIAFDHDFVGREALERMVAEGRDQARKKVTLVWNGEDVARAAADFYRPGLGAKFIDVPISRFATFQFDSVQTSDGTNVGMSTIVGYSANERAILSLAAVDTEHAEPGTELIVLWGENPKSSKLQVEDHLQVPIRVTVQPAPLTEYARTAYRSS